MTKIYTKTGDKGETGLIGGSRVPKNHPRVSAYGDVDELNSHLGTALSHLPKDSMYDPLKEHLSEIQKDLFDIGAILASPKSTSQEIPVSKITKMEQEIDRYTQELPPLKNFILPGGCPPGAALHLARTVCRRAERSVVALSSKEKVTSSVITYLNRLSDFLFTSARWVNYKQGASETLWAQK
ncbi:MAG: cob(I)yrinic acid a,c-diamide adenosyltransferase [Elusimicrobia bacterium]|nr:cob(I)yrinic acid a,c-diamide adenosyltransferase [Elusimicrobiota bacterium]